jgi:hypothetical protein
MDSIIVKEFMIALSVAAVLSGVFGVLTRSKKRRIRLIWCFLIMFVATWAGGAWLQPSGTAPGEVRWLPFMAVGSLFAILAAVFGLRNPPEGRHETLEKLEEIARAKEFEKLTFEVLKIAFWIFFLTLAVAIFLRYATHL